MSNLQSELGPKQLELLKTVVPRIARVAVLYNPGSPISARIVHGVRESAQAQAIEMEFMEVRRPDALAGALSVLASRRTDALLVLSDPVFGGQLARIAQSAARQRLPAVYSRREFAAVGGLLAYGPSFEDNYRRAATYVDKILKGAKLADLPVERPSKYNLSVNNKTARALGLTPR